MAEGVMVLGVDGRRQGEHRGFVFLIDVLRRAGFLQFFDAVYGGVEDPDGVFPLRLAW